MGRTDRFRSHDVVGDGVVALEGRLAHWEARVREHPPPVMAPSMPPEFPDARTERPSGGARRICRRRCYPPGLTRDGQAQRR